MVCQECSSRIEAAAIGGVDHDVAFFDLLRRYSDADIEMLGHIDLPER